MIKLFLLFIVSFLLVGCGQDAPEVIYKYKYIKVTPSKHMVSRIKIPMPPSKVKYLSSDASTKEESLTKYNIRLLSALGHANIKLKAIDDWRSEELNSTSDQGVNNEKNNDTNNGWFNWL